MQTTPETQPIVATRLRSRWLHPDSEALRFLRFGLVGGSGVLVNMTVLWLLHDELSLPLGLSGVAAVLVAICNNFLWNNFWTFRASRVMARRVAQFLVISLVGMVINVSVLKLLVHFGSHYLAANFVGILVATAWNFFANSRWTWAAALAGS